MPRQRPVPVLVTFSRELAPRARRITFRGKPAIKSTRPASYLSLYFRDPGPEWPIPQGEPRPPKRTYTPRYVDASVDAVTIDFVMHGPGSATDWAETAQRGDIIWAGSIMGGYDIPPAVEHVVLVGDDTAIPAIGTILEALPPGVRSTVIIEVVDEDDERAPSDTAPSDPIWLHRGTDVSETGHQTLNLVREISVPDTAHWWVAGEREAVRRIRDVVVDDRGVSRDRLDVNAYWRLLDIDPRARAGLPTRLKGATRRP